MNEVVVVDLLAWLVAAPWEVLDGSGWASLPLLHAASAAVMHAVSTAMMAMRRGISAVWHMEIAPRSTVRCLDPPAGRVQPCAFSRARSMASSASRRRSTPAATAASAAVRNAVRYASLVG